MSEQDNFPMRLVRTKLKNLCEVTGWPLAQWAVAPWDEDSPRAFPGKHVHSAKPLTRLLPCLI